MKKSSTLPTHHERGDEREGGKWRWGEKENGHAEKMSDQACVHQSQIHSQSLRIEVVKPAAQRPSGVPPEKKKTKKGVVQLNNMSKWANTRANGLWCWGIQVKVQKGKNTAIIWQIPM
jgi:hypothetical protein